jgi:hypothetical protein
MGQPIDFGPNERWGQNKEEALCFVPGPVIGEAMPDLEKWRHQ